MLRKVTFSCPTSGVAFNLFKSSSENVISASNSPITSMVLLLKVKKYCDKSEVGPF